MAVNKNKEIEKGKINEYYTQFENLMSKYGNNIRFDNEWFGNRLTSKYYKHAIYKKIVNIINWFINNYGENYYLYFVLGLGLRPRIGDLYVEIADCNDKRFVCYSTKNKTMKSTSDTLTLMFMNFNDNINPDVHYVVNGNTK
jgi:hypothetical protein